LETVQYNYNGRLIIDQAYVAYQINQHIYTTDLEWHC